MSDKEKAFREELAALLIKHGVRVVEHDGYDGEDEYCGSHCNFEGPEIYIPIADLVS